MERLAHVLIAAAAALPACAQAPGPTQLPAGLPARLELLSGKPQAPAETAALADAVWAVAERLPQAKQARLTDEFLVLVQAGGDAGLLARWEERLGRKAPAAQPRQPGFAETQAADALAAYGWEGFLSRARLRAAPFASGRPEIMAAALGLAPDAATRDRLIAVMFDLAGVEAARGRAARADFERGDFGHVLAEAAVTACDLTLFDRATALTAEPDALRYRLWRARITGEARRLVDDIRAGDGTEDTRHVRQAIEGLMPLFERGYCAGPAEPDGQGAPEISHRIEDRSDPSPTPAQHGVIFRLNKPPTRLP